MAYKIDFGEKMLSSLKLPVYGISSLDYSIITYKERIHRKSRTEALQKLTDCL